MQRIITASKLVALLLASLGSTWGQGTIRITFDGSPAMPPGSSANWGYYSESGVAVHTVPSLLGFTRRWSGGALFPDNGSAYLQPAGADRFFFDYLGFGERFNAVSVDLALYSASSLDPVTVQFVASGYYLNDIIATTEYTITGAVDGQGRPLFQTFYFPPEFSRMRWLSITPTTPLWSLDNLVISTIPEPSGFALLVAGGVLLWACRRRG